MSNEFIKDLEFCIENSKTFAFQYQSKLIRFIPVNYEFINTNLNQQEYIKINDKKYSIKDIVEFTDYHTESYWEKFSECEGCRYGINNQLGHMEYGGCLYIS